MAKKAKVTQVQFKELPIELISMSDWNYKNYSDKDLQAKLVKNIKKNGLVENLIVREMDNGTYELVNGHHRYLAVQELGFEKVMCYNLGKISDAQAKRIAIETNETKFDHDDKKLAELLNEINAGFDDFADTNPFTDKEMNKFLDSLEDDLFDDEEPKKPEKSQKTKTAVSVSGEAYQTLKLELTPELADRFNGILERFVNLGQGGQGSVSALCRFIDCFSEEEIFERIGKPDKGPRKKKAEIKKK